MATEQIPLPSFAKAALAGLGFALFASFVVVRLAVQSIHDPLGIALFAVGGVLVGLSAWYYARQCAEAAGFQDGMPVWTGLVAMPSTIVAVIMAGHAVDALEDLRGLAVSVAVVVVYGIVGAVVAMSALAIAALIKRAAAAHRHGERIGAALVPLLRHALGGIALVALLAGAVALYRMPITALLVDATIALGAISETTRTAADAGTAGSDVAPLVARPSAWIEREKRLFSATLDGAGCDVLVAPFEASGPAIDRPGRSLMARTLAAEIVRNTDLCVVDPTLAARAVGLQARTYDATDLLRIATLSGARWLVRGEVALDPQPGTFHVSLLVHARDDKSASWRPPRTINAGSMPFSDETPPEAAFAVRAKAFTLRLGLPLRHQARADATKPATRALPANPAELALDTGSPVDRAERLQLLAIAHARWDHNADQLWERSLVALADSIDHDETARVLAARANLYLFRRPYSVRLLAGRTSPEALALAALADGNLPEAEKRMAAVPTPVARLIGALEIERLRALYGTGATAGFEGRREALLSRHPSYAVLLAAPLSSGDWFHTEVHHFAIDALGALGVDLTREQVGSAARLMLKVLLGTSADFFGLLPGIVERSYVPVWEQHAREWRSARAFDRVAPWDVYDAVYAANRAALAQSISSIRGSQARPKDALGLARHLDPVFRDHPKLQAEIALTLREAADDRSMQQSNSFEIARVRRHARRAYAWEGGESMVSGAIQSWVEDNRLYADQPPRPWRPPPRDRSDRCAATRLDAERAQRYAAHYLRAVQYTQYELWYLGRAVEYLRVAGRQDEARQLLAANDQRFVGHFGRAKLVADTAALTRDAGAGLATLEGVVRAQPEEWTGYYELARAHLRRRDPQAAHQALLAFPGFLRGARNAVGLSNHAHEGGNLLLWAGEAELARSLYERALAYGTGSAAEMWAGLRLAMMGHDYQRAREWGEVLHRRYQNPWGLSNASILYFMMGDAQNGWRLFDDVSQKHIGTIPWEAAFAGHRIAGTDRDRLIAFASKWKVASGPSPMEAMLREHFLFNMLLVDRSPDSETLKAMSPFLGRGGDRAFLLLAQGYDAFKRGEFATAATQLRVLNDALMNVTINQKRSVAYPLPYMVLSLARSNKLAEAEALARSFAERAGQDFYGLIAQAYLDGFGGRHEAAREKIWDAFLRQPKLDDLPIQPPFQLLEACEQLLVLTRDEGYRTLLVDLARRTQIRWPWSWAYTIEAKHSTEPDLRRRAIAIGPYLDPLSERLAGIDVTERKQASAWFAQANPFQAKHR